MIKNLGKNRFSFWQKLFKKIKSNQSTIIDIQEKVEQKVFTFYESLNENLNRNQVKLPVTYLYQVSFITLASYLQPLKYS
jgi:hypothetical protein